jgi:hypothetical protein
MKSRKLFLVGFAVLALTLTNCKKESNTPTTTEPTGDYIRCKVNGVVHTFDKAGSGGNISNYDDNYEGSPNRKVIQMARLEGLMDIFTIDIFKDLDSLKVPQTLSYGANTSIDNYEFMITYMQSFKSYMSIYNEDKSNSSITITSKTNDVIKGTFKGTYYGVNFDTFDLDSVKITDGEFRVKVVRKSLIP